jgi:hypothetical protein
MSDKHTVEINRLQLEVKQWREAHDRVDHRAFALAQERDRLREALEKIKRRGSGEGYIIAKAALAKEVRQVSLPDHISEHLGWLPEKEPGQ